MPAAHRWWLYRSPTTVNYIGGIGISASDVGGTLQKTCPARFSIHDHNAHTGLGRHSASVPRGKGQRPLFAREPRRGYQRRLPGRSNSVRLLIGWEIVLSDQQWLLDSKSRTVHRHRVCWLAGREIDGCQ